MPGQQGGERERRDGALLENTTFPLLLTPHGLKFGSLVTRAAQDRMNCMNHSLLPEGPVHRENLRHGPLSKSRRGPESSTLGPRTEDFMEDLLLEPNANYRETAHIHLYCIF